MLKPCYKRHKCLDRLFNKLRSILFWNSTIKIFIESYTILVMCVLINTTYVSLTPITFQFTFGSPGEIVSSVLTVFFAVLVVIFLLGMGIYLYKNFNNLDDADFRQTIGAMYADLEIKNGSYVLIHVFNFFFRRLVIPLSVVYSHNIVVQIHAMTGSTLLQLIIIGYVKPFKGGSFANKMEMFNECMLLLIMYTMMCFTDLVPDVRIQYKMGYISCVLVVGHLLVNLGLMLYSSLKRLYLKIKKILFLR